MTTPVPGLKRAREAAGMTQAQLAKEAAVRAMTVSDLERGVHTDVKLSVLLRLAAALGVDAAELLAEDDA